MGEHGIDGERVHVLQGTDGIAFLKVAGTFMARLFDDGERQRLMEKLKDGATFVGIFGVTDDDQDRTAAAAEEAGIVVTRRYGKWTYR